jgi:hypothetical protein
MQQSPALCTSLFFLVGLVLTVPAAAAQGAYLWYDADGNAVYSQSPPPGGQPSRLVKPPPPPAESPEVAKERLNQRLQRFEDNREDEALAEEKVQEAKSEAAAAQQRCTEARRNLELLDSSVRRRFQMPDGSVRRLTEEERQPRRAEYEKIIAEDCR